MDINDVLTGPTTPDTYSIREHYRLKDNLRKIGENRRIKEKPECVCEALVENKRLENDLQEAISLLQTLFKNQNKILGSPLPYEYSLTVESVEKEMRNKGWLE